MTYGLAIDVGTTFTSAAINREGLVEIVPLDEELYVPTVIWADDHEMVFGRAAERRGVVRPGGLAREFKRRIGFPTPIMLSGSPYDAAQLMARMAGWVIDKVSEQEGERPSNVTMTHPAKWTEHQLREFRLAVEAEGVEVALLAEPAAAAWDYASTAVLQRDAKVLVYDLGGGTFDVALLQLTERGFRIVAEPLGIERLGGVDFDETLFRFVISQVPSEVLTEARRQVDGTSAVADVRRACINAKKSLSSDVAADVPIRLPPNYTSSVRVTRAEFEHMIEPTISQTVDFVRLALARSELAPGELSLVLLVGGSSRIPMIAQMVAKELGVKVRVDKRPKLVVVLGAARRTSAHPAGQHERSRRRGGIGAVTGRRRRRSADPPAAERAPAIAAPAAEAVEASIGIAAAGVLAPSADLAELEADEIVVEPEVDEPVEVTVRESEDEHDEPDPVARAPGPPPVVPDARAGEIDVPTAQTDIDAEDADEIDAGTELDPEARPVASAVTAARPSPTEIPESGPAHGFAPGRRVALAAAAGLVAAAVVATAIVMSQGGGDGDGAVAGRESVTPATTAATPGQPSTLTTVALATAPTTEAPTTVARTTTSAATTTAPPPPGTRMERFPIARVTMAVPEGWLVVTPEQLNDPVFMETAGPEFKLPPGSLSSIVGNDELSGLYLTINPDGTAANIAVQSGSLRGGPFPSADEFVNGLITQLEAQGHAARYAEDRAPASYDIGRGFVEVLWHLEPASDFRASTVVLFEAEPVVIEITTRMATETATIADNIRATIADTPPIRITPGSTPTSGP